MSVSLRILLLIFSVVLTLATTVVVKKGRMPIKYSLLWYFSSLIIFVLSVFPFIIEYISELFGFKTLSNLITAIMICILLFLTMSLTIITAGQKRKITLLIQEISILKKRVEELEKSCGENGK